MSKYKVEFIAKVRCRKEIDIQNEANPYVELEEVIEKMEIDDFWLDNADIDTERLTLLVPKDEE